MVWADGNDLKIKIYVNLLNFTFLVFDYFQTPCDIGRSVCISWIFFCLECVLAATWKKMEKKLPTRETSVNSKPLIAARRTRSTHTHSFSFSLAMASFNAHTPILHQHIKSLFVHFRQCKTNTHWEILREYDIEKKSGVEVRRKARERERKEREDQDTCCWTPRLKFPCIIFPIYTFSVCYFGFCVWFNGCEYCESERASECYLTFCRRCSNMNLSIPISSIVFSAFNWLLYIEIYVKLTTTTTTIETI